MKSESLVPKSESRQLHDFLEVFNVCNKCDERTRTTTLDSIFPIDSTDEDNILVASATSLALSLLEHNFLRYIALRIHKNRTSKNSVSILQGLIRDQASILPKFQTLQNLDQICPELAYEIVVHVILKNNHVTNDVAMDTEMENFVIAWINSLPILMLPIQFDGAQTKSIGMDLLLHFLQIVVIDGTEPKAKQRPSCGILHHSILKALSTQASKTKNEKLKLISSRVKTKTNIKTESNSGADCTLGDLGYWPRDYLESLKPKLVGTTGVAVVRLCQAVAVAHAQGFMDSEIAVNGSQMLKSLNSNESFVQTVISRLQQDKSS